MSRATSAPDTSTGGTVTVRQGKGRKDRVVPIGERALHWIFRYLDEARPEIVVPPDDGVLFLGERGEPLGLGYLTNLMKSYVDEAKLGKTGACHIFRHTMATLMLENGADVRYLQALLGHAQLSTTELYTRVSITQLKAVHQRTHPAHRTSAERQAQRAVLAAEAAAAEAAERAGAWGARTSSGPS